MLTGHGLVIIATEIQDIKINTGWAKISFVVATETPFTKNNDKLLRHNVQLIMSDRAVDDWKSRIEIGRIADISYCEFIESSYLPKDKSKEYSHVTLSVKADNFKVLMPCVYYENIKNITKK
ncbi:MAG TPA: hypothetical protein VMX17_01545 [Candidatus Glassbacteria bacterium]|nr:hypothetical protein [Candidatus Glassbacteria bacterium]